MSNNTPDYDNNLAFEPKSADDLNKQERQSDVLISAIERCEKLEKQLKIAIKALESYANDELWSDTSEELFFFDGCFCSNGYQLAQDALKQIGEKK